MRRVMGTTARTPDRQATWWTIGLVIALIGTQLLVMAPGIWTSSAEATTPPIVTGDDVRVDAFVADVDVDDALARTAIRLELATAAEEGREARVRMPLPPTATLSGFNLTVGNRTYVGQVLEADRARQRYDEAKEAGRDAVLLHRVGDGLVSLTVHVTPGQPRVLRLAYVEHLGLERGERVYRLPTSRLTADGAQVGSVHLTVEATSSHGVRSLDVEGVDLETVRTGDGFEATARRADVSDLGDLRVAWREGGGAWLPSAVAAHAPGSEGSNRSHLLVNLALRRNVSDGALPRDVVFVLDHSGSMSGSKIEQAKRSLRTVLPRLREHDRFAVLAFDDEVSRLTEGLVPADAPTIDRARREVAGLRADGSTDVDAALQKALDLIGSRERPERVPVVVVVTDGLPTAGVTQPDRIVERAHASNEREAGIHPIAIGLDADRSFLKDLAMRTGGHLVETTPDGNLASRLEGYYEELSDPLATDLSIRVEGVPHGEVLPRVIGSIYRGDTLALVMRADLSEVDEVTVHVEGRTPDGPFDRTFAVDAGGISVDPAVARLWGQARVEALLSTERMEGTRPDLRQAIVDNATRYGVVTPYTSWVVVEPVEETTAPSPARDATAADGAPVTDPADPAAHGAPDASPTVPGFELVGVVAAVAFAVWGRHG